MLAVEGAFGGVILGSEPISSPTSRTLPADVGEFQIGANAVVLGASVVTEIELAGVAVHPTGVSLPG